LEEFFFIMDLEATCVSSASKKVTDDRNKAADAYEYNFRKFAMTYNGKKDNCIQIDTIATLNNNNHQTQVETIPSSPGSFSVKSNDMRYTYEKPINSCLLVLQVVAAILLCFPFGLLALHNIIKMRKCIKNGDKRNAARYESYVINLLKTSIVVGLLLWFIVILVLIVQLVILKKTIEPAMIQ